MPFLPTDHFWHEQFGTKGMRFYRWLCFAAPIAYWMILQGGFVQIRRGRDRTRSKEHHPLWRIS